MNEVVLERVFGNLIYQLDIPDELIEDVMRCAFQSVISSGGAMRCALYAFDQKMLDAGVVHTPRRSRGSNIATEIACESRIGDEITDHVRETASRSVYASKPIWCESPCGRYMSRYFPILATSETAPSMSFCSNMPNGYVSRLGVLVITFTTKVDVIEWSDTSPFKRMVVCYMLRHLNPISSESDCSSEVKTSPSSKDEVVVKSEVDLTNLDFFLELAYAMYHISLDESQSHTIPKFLKFFYQLHIPLTPQDHEVGYMDIHMVRECIHKSMSSPFCGSIISTSSNSSPSSRKIRKVRKTYMFTHTNILERVLRVVSSMMLQSQDFNVDVSSSNSKDPYRRYRIADYIDVNVSGVPIFPRDRFRFAPTYILNAVEHIIKELGWRVTVSSTDSTHLTVSLHIPNASREMSEVWLWSNTPMTRRARRVIVTVVSSPDYIKLAYDVFDVACQWGCQVRLVDAPHLRSHPKVNEIRTYVFDTPLVDGVVITQHAHIKMLYSAVKRLLNSKKRHIDQK